nr:hypothetical protein [Tanacetum cinerariifolium]
MVKSISSSENEACCSKSCKKNTDGLNSKITELSEKLGDTKNMLYHYKLVYSPSKKDMSWTGLPEFANDTITDYSRPTPTIESNSDDLQNKKPSVTETKASSSTILSKPAIKFVKATERPTINKVETVKKPSIKYAKMYRKTSKRKTRPKNNHTHKSMPPRAVVYKIVRSPTRTNRPNMNDAQPKRTSFAKLAHSYVRRPFHGRSAVRTQSQVLRVSTMCCCFSRQVDTARPMAVINRRNWVNDVKASTCWVQKPVKPNSALIILKKYDYCKRQIQGRIVGNKMLQVIPTASYEDLTAKYFATVSAKKFPLLVHFHTAGEEVFSLLS